MYGRSTAAPQLGAIDPSGLFSYRPSIQTLESVKLFPLQTVYTTETIMTPDQTNLLLGTLDMLILKSLALTELHGLGISRRISQITKGTFYVKPGSLFPALHRMEEQGWLAASWGESENNRRAKYYKITAAGRRQLNTETKRWSRISLAIARALESN